MHGAVAMHAFCLFYYLALVSMPIDEKLCNYCQFYE